MERYPGLSIYPLRSLSSPLRLCAKQLSTLLLTVSLLTTLSSPSSSQFRYRIDSSPDAWLAPVALTASVGAYLLSRSAPSLSVAELNALNKGDIPSFDRWATEFSSLSVRRASDVALGISVALPLIVLSEFDADYLHIAGMYAETMALTWTVTAIVKSVGRTRPLAYNPDAALEDRLSSEMTQSFPSGHTSISVAAMVFMATVYEGYHPGSKTAKAIWIGGVGLGLTTGALRILSGMHFPTDVLAGAVIGGVIGYVVPKLHEVSPGANLGTTLGPNATPILHISIPL